MLKILTLFMLLLQVHVSRFQRVVLETGLFTNEIAKYCRTADLASIASTFKAAFPALFLLTARDCRIILLSKVLSNMDNLWTWRQHPTRIAHISFLAIDVDQSLLPSGLDGVQKAWVRVQSSCNLPLPPNLRWLKYEYSFRFCEDTDVRHKRCSMWWNIHDDADTDVYYGSDDSDVVTSNTTSYLTITGLHTLKYLEVLYIARPLLQELKRGMLPATIKGLLLEEGSFPIQVDALPSTLEELDLGQAYQHPLVPGAIPQSVLGLVVSERVDFIANLDVSVEAGIIPSGLQFLGLRSHEPKLERDMRVLRPSTDVTVRQVWSKRKYF